MLEILVENLADVLENCLFEILLLDRRWLVQLCNIVVTLHKSCRNQASGEVSLRFQTDSFLRDSMRSMKFASAFDPLFHCVVATGSQTRFALFRMGACL